MQDEPSAASPIPTDSAARRRYLRIDSVHQATWMAIKASIISMRERRLRSLKWWRRGFHSDNGSEYMNKRVAKLLDKLQWRQVTGFDDGSASRRREGDRGSVTITSAPLHRA